MITSSSQRYLFTLDDGNVVRYDRYLRRSKPIDLGSASAGQAEQRAPTARQAEWGSGGRIRIADFTDHEGRVEVRLVDEPGACVASGEFCNGTWTFDGMAAEWAHVDEYLLLPGEPQRLLRIADESTPVPLDEVGPVVSVHTVPGTHFVVLTGGGFLTVFDPVSGRVLERLRIVGDAENVTPAFRPDVDELWVNSGPTLVALDTRTWEVTDAAGYDGDGEISCWRFVDENSALVARHDSAVVLLLDLKTMLPTSAAQLSSSPRDVMSLDGTVYATSADGTFEKAKLKEL